MPNLWERQPIDTDESFKAFCTYRDQIPPRRFRGLGPTATIAEWYRDHGWRERIAAYDAWLDSIMLREREEALKKAARNQGTEHALLLVEAREFLGLELAKFLKTSKEHEIQNLRPHEMIRLLEQVIKLERLVQGETTENVSQQVDLSKLSVEELRQLEALHRKVENE